MKFYLKSLFVASFVGLLFGCSSSKTSDAENVPESELFTKAQQELQNGNIKSSIKLLEDMDKTYPFGPYSQQVQLELIYGYYKTADYPVCVASIDRFLKLNPTHPNADWVLYMRGLANMAQDDNLIQNWFNVDRTDRDTAFAKVAFKDFSYLILNYPHSPYSYDAEKRLVFLKNRLANYQLKVAQYYMDREAYVAVINRVTNMLSDYADTDATKDALFLMKKAYAQLGLENEAQKTDQLIQANLNNVSPAKTEKSFFGIF